MTRKTDSKWLRYAVAPIFLVSLFIGTTRTWADDGEEVFCWHILGYIPCAPTSHERPQAEPWVYRSPELDALPIFFFRDHSGEAHGGPSPAHGQRVANASSADLFDLSDFEFTPSAERFTSFHINFEIIEGVLQGTDSQVFIRNAGFGLVPANRVLYGIEIINAWKALADLGFVCQGIDDLSQQFMDSFPNGRSCAKVQMDRNDPSVSYCHFRSAWHDTSKIIGPNYCIEVARLDPNPKVLAQYNIGDWYLSLGGGPDDHFSCSWVSSASEEVTSDLTTIYTDFVGEVLGQDAVESARYAASRNGATSENPTFLVETINVDGLSDRYWLKVDMTIEYSSYKHQGQRFSEVFVTPHFAGSVRSSFDVTDYRLLYPGEEITFRNRLLEALKATLVHHKIGASCL